MSTFANQLKAEISRLARKEARTEVGALKKSATQYRSEIATLKKRVSELENFLKKLAKEGQRGGSKATSEAPEKTLRFRVSGFGLGAALPALTLADQIFA